MALRVVNRQGAKIVNTDQREPSQTKKTTDLLEILQVSDKTQAGELNGFRVAAATRVIVEDGSTLCQNIKITVRADGLGEPEQDFV